MGVVGESPVSIADPATMAAAAATIGRRVPLWEMILPDSGAKTRIIAAIGSR